MSTFIQIPNRINQLTKQSKLEEIFTYAAIRSQIKCNNLQAVFPQNQLAELVGVNERTIRNYTDILEKSGLIIDTTKKHGTGEYAHNVYQLDYIANEYFIMNPELITEESISAKLKGLLMLIKSYCIKGTNNLPFKSKKHLAEEVLHIGKNQLSAYLKELEAKKFIRIIGKTLVLPKKFFKLFIDDYIENLLYETIYDYCLSQDVVPPYKDKDTNDIGMIAAHYTTPDELLFALRRRCLKLPKNVSMAYFAKILRNKRAETKKTNEFDFEFILD